MCVYCLVCMCVSVCMYMCGICIDEHIIKFMIFHISISLMMAYCGIIISQKFFHL